MRKWIKLKDLNMYDEFHYQVGDSFEVNVQLDGNTTEYHKQGIEYLKTLLESGVKILPILVVDNEDGTYDLLDGFKRSRAHFELHREHIEAFVASQDDYRERKEYPFGDNMIRCYKGGLNYEKFNIFEGKETEDSTYGNVYFLYKGNSINIEARENIHIHWGEFGRYRLEMGRNDFLALAEGMCKWVN